MHMLFQLHCPQQQQQQLLRISLLVLFIIIGGIIPFCQGIRCFMCQARRPLPGSNETGNINATNKHDCLSLAGKKQPHTGCPDNNPAYQYGEVEWLQVPLSRVMYGQWCVKISFVAGGVQYMSRDCSFPSPDRSESGCAEHFDVTGLAKNVRSCWCNTEKCNAEPGWIASKPGKGQRMEENQRSYWEKDLLSLYHIQRERQKGGAGAARLTLGLTLSHCIATLSASLFHS